MLRHNVPQFQTVADASTIMGLAGHPAPQLQLSPSGQLNGHQLFSVGPGTQALGGLPAELLAQTQLGLPGAQLGNLGDLMQAAQQQQQQQQASINIGGFKLPLDQATMQAALNASNARAGLPQGTLLLPPGLGVMAAAAAPQRSGDSRSGSAYASRHQAAEQRRRLRINERLDSLRKLVPHAERANTACFLEEVIKYISALRERSDKLESFLGTALNALNNVQPAVAAGIAAQAAASGLTFGTGSSGDAAAEVSGGHPATSAAVSAPPPPLQQQQQQQQVFVADAMVQQQAAPQQSQQLLMAVPAQMGPPTGLAVQQQQQPSQPTPTTSQQPQAPPPAQVPQVQQVQPAAAPGVNVVPKAEPQVAPQVPQPQAAPQVVQSQVAAAVAAAAPQSLQAPPQAAEVEVFSSSKDTRSAITLPPTPNSSLQQGAPPQPNPTISAATSNGCSEPAAAAAMPAPASAPVPEQQQQLLQPQQPAVQPQQAAAPPPQMPMMLPALTPQQLQLLLAQALQMQQQTLQQQMQTTTVMAGVSAPTAGEGTLAPATAGMPAAPTAMAPVSLPSAAGTGEGAGQSAGAADSPASRKRARSEDEDGDLDDL